MITNDDAGRNTDYSNFKGWQREPFGRYKQHWAAYYASELARSQKLSGQTLNRPLRILEIGFGNGEFLEWARDQGHTVVGIDIDDAQLEAASAAGFSVAESIEVLTGKIDLCELDGVVAFDVFEHFSAANLISLLGTLCNLLSPRGWVLARFPNGDSPFGRLNQHGDLTHISTLGAVAVAQLAHMSGMRLAFVGSPILPITGVGMFRMFVHLMAYSVRFLAEVPIQALLNAYYVGRVRWYPLHPNLLAVFTK